MDKAEILAKNLHHLANETEEYARSLGVEPKEIILDMGKPCGCFAGFLGGGSYDEGDEIIAGYLDMYAENADALLHQYGVITKEQYWMGMTGPTAFFFLENRIEDRGVKNIGLDKVISKLREYGDCLRLKSEAD